MRELTLYTRGDVVIVLEPVRCSEHLASTRWDRATLVAALLASGESLTQSDAQALADAIIGATGGS